LLAFDQGRVEEAQALFNAALVLHREAGDLQYEGTTLGNLGNLVRRLNRNPEAIALYEQALGLQRGLGNRRMEGVLLGNLGVVYQTQARLPEAQTFYGQALAIGQALGYLSLQAAMTGNLATLLYAQDRLAEAVPLCEQAIAIYRQTGEKPQEGHTLVNLADLLLENGRPEEARQAFERALKIHREIGSWRNEAICQVQLARLMRICGEDLREAEQRVCEASERFLQFQDSYELLLCLLEQAHQALSAGKTAQPFLSCFEQTAAETRLEPGNALWPQVEQAREAQAAFAAGEPQRLFRGELIERLPAGLRRWLRETGQLAL
jgi:tetratricopeptide (TPR) repeat protein